MDHCDLYWDIIDMRQNIPAPQTEYRLPEFQNVLRADDASNVLEPKPRDLTLLYGAAPAAFHFCLLVAPVAPALRPVVDAVIRQSLIFTALFTILKLSTQFILKKIYIG